MCGGIYSSTVVDWVAGVHYTANEIGDPRV